MVIQLKEFFLLIMIHHRLPETSREADLAGRLAATANPANARIRVSDLTRRCVQRFIAKRTGT